MMAFQLHVTDAITGCAAQIVFSESDQELLGLQMTRCMNCGGIDRVAQWLSVALASSLPAVVDYDLKPPSEAQVNFAMAIARALRLALPPDVLRYRGAMHDFLSSYKEAFDARPIVRTPSTKQAGHFDEGSGGASD